MSSAPQRSHGRKRVQVTGHPQELMTDRPALAKTWTAKVITLFPEAFPGVLGASLTGKALGEGLWALEPIDLRRFGEGKHRNVDDTPFGGGAGMVLRPDVMARAIDTAHRAAPDQTPLIYLSPRGAPFTQDRAQRLAQGPGLTLICGRFEGLDQRVIDAYGVEELSLGDFVITGGEIAAQAVIDATVRLLPNVIGNADSLTEESFATGLLEHPHYTKPAEWEGRAVPEVLLSGHHGNIADWRRTQAEKATQARRPDLWKRFSETKSHRKPPD
ncbi:MAG: tRNA (guanosine(37)-N1)-methyltransferase TrmD [Pseudomonadota bacterium]